MNKADYMELEQAKPGTPLYYHVESIFRGLSFIVIGNFVANLGVNASRAIRYGTASSEGLSQDAENALNALQLATASLVPTGAAIMIGGLIYSASEAGKLGSQILSKLGDCPGVGAMERPNGPKPTPRLNYDVRTGLPNHRATPQEAEGILAELHWQERTDSVLASPKPSVEVRNNTLRRARLHEEVWGKPTLASTEPAQTTPALSAEFKSELARLVFDGSYGEHADGLSVDDESEYDEPR